MVLPFVLALTMNNLEQVQLAVAATNDINGFIHESFPYTPLHLAILLRSSLEITEFLIDQGADVNSVCGESTDPYIMSKCTPLHLAINKSKRIEIDYAKLLISRGADVNKVCSGNQTALHLAVRTKNINLVELVLRSNANVNATSDYGSPLMIFAENFIHGTDNLDIMKLLLQFGADVNCVSDKYPNESVRHVVVKRRLVEALKLLVNQNLGNINVNSVTANGMSAPHYDVQGQNLSDDVIRVLLDTGIDWRITDMYGNTASDYCPRLLTNLCCSDSVAESLLANGYFEVLGFDSPAE